jgi:DNA-binding protein HU-beta
MAKAAQKGAISAKTGTGKPAKPVVTITLKQIAAEIAESQGLSKKQAEAVLNETVIRITKGIVKGQRVRFGALGIFRVKKLATRMGRNPATGQAIKYGRPRSTPELRSAAGSSCRQRFDDCRCQVFERRPCNSHTNVPAKLDLYRRYPPSVARPVPERPPPRQIPRRPCEARGATDKSARERHPCAARPRKPMRTVQKPPRQSTASGPRSNAGAAPGPTAPQLGSSHRLLHQCKRQCLHSAKRSRIIPARARRPLSKGYGTAA